MPEGSDQPDFHVTRLTAEDPLYEDEFSVFLVQVKSETEAGHALLVDPIAFFEENIPDMGLSKGPDTSAMVLRVNAEISANPRHRSEIWVSYPGSTKAIGLQYKYERDMLNG